MQTPAPENFKLTSKVTPTYCCFQEKSEILKKRLEKLQPLSSEYLDDMKSEKGADCTLEQVSYGYFHQVSRGSYLTGWRIATKQTLRGLTANYLMYIS